MKFYPEYIREHKISAKSIINPDETRCTIQGEIAEDGIESTGKRKRSVQEMTRGLGATYIPFPNSLGEMIMSVFILPLDKKGKCKFRAEET